MIELSIEMLGRYKRRVSISSIGTMVYSMPPYLNSPRNILSFVKSRRQYNVGDYLLQQDLTTVYDSLGKANPLNNYFYSVFTKEDKSYMSSLDPNSSYPNMDQIVITSTGIQKQLRFSKCK